MYKHLELYINQMKDVPRNELNEMMFNFDIQSEKIKTRKLRKGVQFLDAR